MNTTILQNLNGLLEDQFQLSSYCDYLRNGEQKVSNLIGALTSVVDEFDPATDVEVVASLDSETIASIMNRFDGLDMNACVALNSGFAKVENIVQGLNTGMADYFNSNKNSMEDITITVYDAAGNPVDQQITITEVIDDLKGSLASSAMERAAIEASAEESIADKLTKFETLASQTVDVNNSQFKSMCSYYKSLLISKVPGHEIVQRIFKDSGAEDFAEEEPTVISDYPISEFTGVSPLGAFSLNCISNVATAVGKVIGATASVIGAGLAKVGKWIFGKVHKYTTEIFSNPYDIIDNGNENTTYCFNGFQYQHHYNNFVGDFFLNISDAAELNAVLASKSNTWYTLKTVGGEFAIKWSDFHVEYHDDGQGGYLSHFTGDLLFKPYSLREIVVAQPDGYTVDEYLEALNSSTESRYLSTNDSEADLLNSFVNGTAIACGLLENYAFAFNWGSSNYRLYPSSFTHYTSVTNKDVFEVATGYEEVGGVATFSNFPKNIRIGADGVSSGWVVPNISYIGEFFMVLLASHYYNNEINNPNANIAVYTPFCHGTEGMSEGRFGIKTDSINKNISTAIAAALIVITVAVIVIATGVIIAKKLARKAFFKRTQFVGQCDNAMWNGQGLTKAYQKKYIRYQRKLNASNILTKGISAAEVAESVTGSSPIQDLYQNIMGAVTTDGSPDTSLNEIKSILV